MRPGWLPFLAAIAKRVADGEPEPPEHPHVTASVDGQPSRAEEIAIRAAAEGRPIEMRVRTHTNATRHWCRRLLPGSGPPTRPQDGLGSQQPRARTLRVRIPRPTDPGDRGRP